MEEKKRGAAALLLTYICLFVVLDEFSELKVSSNNGDLQKEIDGQRGGRSRETHNTIYL